MMPQTETLSEGNYPVDADLFYVLATVLLLAILLALLAGLSTLNSIKNSLAGGTGGAARETTGGMSSLGGVAESSAYDLPATSATQTGSAYAASPEASSYAQPEPAPTSYSQPEEVSTGFVSMAEVEPQIAQASSGAMTLRGDEPEEQPFEREGRWWFKRGGELLVYEEGTGQWVPTSGSSAGGVAPASTATSTFPTTGGDIGVSQVDSGEGWKCSSCGAINGSTATSCRMCFTPR